MAETGRAASSRDGTIAGQHVEAMLAYFDALGSQETPASYVCGAILAGMASAFVPEDPLRYLQHLAVCDHVEAINFAAQGAQL